MTDIENYKDSSYNLDNISDKSSSRSNSHTELPNVIDQNNNNNNNNNKLKNPNGNEKSPIDNNSNINTRKKKKNDDHDEDTESLDTKRFWQSIGIIFQICGVLAVTFTIFLGLYLDAIIKWSFWILFLPVFAILLIAFISTGSKTLSKIVSWVIRFLWRIWIIGLSLFVTFLIVHIQYGKLSTQVLLIPLFITFGMTLLMGIYSFIFGICFNSNRPARKRKYIVSGIPMFFTGATLVPSIILIALKYSDPSGGSGAASDTGFHPSWAICFIPLFIGDAISGCFSFFLLLFSFNSKENATFSFTQLLSVLFIILCSVVFKILYALKLDNSNSTISYICIFIPVLVGELFLIFCGINLLIRPAKTNYNVNNDEILIIESDSESESRPLLKNKK